MTQRPVDPRPPESQRLWLTLDAGVTGLCAVVYLAAAPVVVELLGSTTTTTRGLGAFLLGFAALVALAAVRTPASPAAVVGIVGVNTVWVLASAVVVLTGALDLNAIGLTWTAAQAAVVAALATQQLRTRER